ncbi:sensor histidine kinase [Cohnella soli]|uniref:histidine kinase n=1 Tax=Cohnella soli TaxID=425005 RepID=A0ABW0HT99_9BACL
MKGIAEACQRLFLGSIQRKLVFAFLFLIVLPIVLSGIISFSLIQASVKSKANIGNEMALSQAGAQVERVFRDMIIASNTLMLDDEISEIVAGGAREDPSERYYASSIMNSKFFNIQTSTLDYYANNFIAVIDQSGDMYTTIPSESGASDTLAQLLKQEGAKADSNYVKMGGSAYVIDFSPLGKKIRYIVLIRAYMELGNGKKQGDIVIGMPEKEISGILRGLGSEQGIGGYVINGEGKIISSSNEDEVGQTFPYWAEMADNPAEDINFLELKKQHVIVNARYLERLGWRVMQVVPDDVLFADASAIRNSLLYVNLLFLFVFFGLSFFIARSLSRPIAKLNKATEQLASGNLEARVDVLRKDELGMLSVKFNKMASQIHELFAKVNEEQKTKRELELKMLYAQINPHFLFNTLNSIRWLADASKVFNVSKVIVALANLLKSSILHKNEWITVREEIDNVKNYVTIQKFRYASLFIDEYDIDDSIADCGIPKLILQPIVENSIIHGFEGLSRKGLIRIRARKEGEKIVITVSDNGVGADRQRLDEMMTGQGQGGQSGKFSGIGIHNVNARLVLHYGTESALRVQSEPGEGMITTVVIPIRQMGPEVETHV